MLYKIAHAVIASLFHFSDKHCLRVMHSTLDGAISKKLSVRLVFHIDQYSAVKQRFVQNTIGVHLPDINMHLL